MNFAVALLGLLYLPAPDLSGEWVSAGHDRTPVLIDRGELLIAGAKVGELRPRLSCPGEWDCILGADDWRYTRLSADGRELRIQAGPTRYLANGVPVTRVVVLRRQP